MKIHYKAKTFFIPNKGFMVFKMTGPSSGITLLKNFIFFSFQFFAHISLDMLRILQNRKKIVNPELEPVILNIINPIFGTKNVLAIYWNSNFSLRDIFKENL